MLPVAKINTLQMPQVAHAFRSLHVEDSGSSFIVPRYWGMHLYRYSANVAMDGVPMHFDAGWAGFTPPGARMDYEFRGRCVHTFAHLEWSDEATLDTEVPYLFSVGTEFELLWDRLEEVVGLHRSNPLRANVRAWDVLLQLVDISHQPKVRDESTKALDRAFSLIDEQLSEAISVENLAIQVGISASHLRRLFREREGESVIGTIQNRRMDRAKHLLQQTTLPIKEIAGMVGLPDLQHFNKSVRKAFGTSPSGLRG